MKRKYTFKLLSVFVCAQLAGATQATWACDVHGKSGFLPKEYELHIGPNEKADSGLSRAQFFEVANKLKGVYGPVVKKLGATLHVPALWPIPMTNAAAVRYSGNKLDPKGKQWVVILMGGMARLENMTPDSFLLIACHELGHHLGGAPKKANDEGVPLWGSNEGQADYWASSKCFRKIVAKENNQHIVSQMQVHPDAVSTCRKQFSSDLNAQAICQRSAMAALNLGQIMASLMDISLPELDTPDRSEVEKTYHNHPLPQCRVDTYFAGSSCSLSADKAVSSSDPEVGVCTRQKGHKIGVRSRCWYLPPRPQLPLTNLSEII